MLKTCKQFGKFIFSLGIRVGAGILLGTLLLTLAYLIPTEKMQQHMQTTAASLWEEGPSPQLFSWCTSSLDNFTDSLMLTNAAHRSDAPAIIQAMKANKFYVKYADNAWFDMNDHYILGESYTGEVSYARYWHGYLVFLKPLFSLINYKSIRILNGLLQSILFFAVVLLLVRKGMKGYLLPYAISVAFLMPVTLAMSLQYSSCYYILTLGCLGLLLIREHSERSKAFLFLYIGIATAFFDLLTYPIATLGVPAALYLCMKSGNRLGETLRDLIKVCFCWGFGYGTMWIGKWAVGSLITGENLFTDALNSVQVRTTHSSMEIYGEVVENPTWTAVMTNLELFGKTPASVLMTLLVTVLLVLFAAGVVKKKTSCAVLLRTIPFLAAACLPVAWYMLTANHSIVHAWFTHKALVAAAFPVMCMFVKINETA